MWILFGALLVLAVLCGLVSAVFAKRMHDANDMQFPVEVGWAAMFQGAAGAFILSAVGVLLVILL
jgi:nitrate/nitrite transporter NarK